MIRILLNSVFLLAACSLNSVYAANAEEAAAVPEPPELPAPIQSGEEMQPDLTMVKNHSGIPTQWQTLHG